MSIYADKLQRFDRTSILGWSNTRFDTFGQCKRKYFYQYYGKHDVEHDLRKINLLKELTTVPLEVGNISHKVIQRLLKRLQKTDAPINLEQFYSYVEQETLAICSQKNFEEIHYKKRDSIDFKLEVFPLVSKAMDNFLQSDRMQWLLEEALAYKDDWLIEFGDDYYGECRIDDLKSYCKVDFMFPIEDELHILDWKTGKEHYAKYSTQLHGYAGWANFHFGKEYSKIKTTIAYLLPEYKEKSVEITEFHIDDFTEHVRSQTDEMYKYCSEPEFNIPLAKDVFKMTPVVNFCKYCKFRELCDRE